MGNYERIDSLRRALEWVRLVRATLDAKDSPCPSCGLKVKRRMSHFVAGEFLDSALTKITRAIETIEKMGLKFDDEQTPEQWKESRDERAAD